MTSSRVWFVKQKQVHCLLKELSIFFKSQIRRVPCCILLSLTALTFVKTLRLFFSFSEWECNPILGKYFHSFSSQGLICPPFPPFLNTFKLRDLTPNSMVSMAMSSPNYLSDRLVDSTPFGFIFLFIFTEVSSGWTVSFSNSLSPPLPPPTPTIHRVS